jgi:hypothetical protein
MTQIAGVEISRGRTRLAAGIALFHGISRAQLGYIAHHKVLESNTTAYYD